MTVMKRTALALLLCLLAFAATAQNVTVIGPITPGDCTMFSSTTVVKDGGFPCPGSGGTLALPNGTTATKQTPGNDNTNKVATDSFVQDAISLITTHFAAGGVSTGSANAQVVATTSPPVFSLSGNPTVTFVAGFSNTSATTLNVVSTGAISVLKKTPAGLVALVTGDIISGQQYIATYDGTQYELQGPSQTTNAQLAQMPANTMKCNNTGSLGAVLDCTVAQVRQLINGWFNVLNSQVANYSVDPTDCGKTIQLGTGATGFFTLTFPSVAGFVSNCTLVVVDGDTARGKAIVGLTGITKMYQTQSFNASIVNGAWALLFKPPRYLVPVGGALTMYFDKDRGTDTNDCLAVGTGACATSGQLMTDLSTNIDNEGTVTFQQGCTATPCTYTDIPFQSTGYVGAGAVVLQGDTATNSNYTWTCAVTCANGAVINFNIGTSGNWTVQGFTITSTLSTGAGIQIKYVQGATILHQKNTFGAFTNGIAISCIGPAHVNDVASGNYTISGGGASFGSAQDGCIMHFDQAVGTLTGTPAFASGFLVSHGAGAVMGTDNTHFSGAATGAHCASTLLALVDTAGTSASLPGNSACNPAPGVNTTVGSLGYVN